ncbi:MAG: DUF1588 domain-containing protein, partial [Polyangiaceae bacterium]
MRQAKLRLLLCSGLLACSGRYVSNPGDGAGATSAMGGTSSGASGTSQVTPPLEAGSPAAVGGATSVGSGSAVAGAPPQMVTDTACGVPVGQTTAITDPIANYMTWWFRLSRLIWGAEGHAAPEMPSPLSYQQAGRIADTAIDQASAETKGIPGVGLFVRNWLQVEDVSTPLLADWNSALSTGAAIDALLTLRFDSTRLGAFSEPAFLSANATISWRGTVMSEALFAQVVPLEPPGVAPFVAPAGLTRREGLSQAVASANCAVCHALIDPLGWSLENYDQYGKYVRFDAGQAVDASGSYRLSKWGGAISFANVEDLGLQLTRTCDANLGLADGFLSFAIEQS